jgi:hypothetical protein
LLQFCHQPQKRLPQKELMIEQHEFEALYGKKLPVHDEHEERPYDWNHTLEDIRHTLIEKR